MRQKLVAIVQLIAFTLVGVLGAFAAGGQEAPAPSLEEQIEAQYNMAKVHKDGTVEPGTVLVIQKAGLFGVPPSSVTMAPATYADGVLKPPNEALKIGRGILDNVSKPVSAPSKKEGRTLPVGEKVYVTQIEVNPNHDRVEFRIVECDTCNSGITSASFKSQIFFQFPKGSLAKPDVPAVEDTISQVFALEGAVPATPQVPTTQSPVAPGAAAPTAPVQIQLGQSIDQVVAALGQPEKKVNLGSKQIYVYKDLKVTFVNGKVSDVQ
jgi:hypothetical protein